MREIRRQLLGSLGMVLAFGLLAAADTLQLKNGTVVQGKYLGGSERALQFEVGGKIELYPVSDVLSVTFTGTPTSSSTPAAPTMSSAALTPRPAAPGATPLASSGSAVTVPAGTRLVVRMIDGVDSATNHVGDKFRASLESDLLVNGVVVAPKGTDVYGRLAEAQQAGRLAGKADRRV
jgi:hypothetical protein